ncbi:hypothetical protein [Pseudonocardia sp. T1-2H]|uniref:hypothetical protein n=1 Tax=Pseudonocardia sp. T1-2H TaxID=3128899 RepID=UPI003101A572
MPFSPTAAFPRNRTLDPSAKGRCSTRITDFIFTWSGATPYRTRPYGAGRRSSTSTSTGPTSEASSAAAA